MGTVRNIAADVRRISLRLIPYRMAFSFRPPATDSADGLCDQLNGMLPYNHYHCPGDDGKAVPMSDGRILIEITMPVVTLQEDERRCSMILASVLRDAGLLNCSPEELRRIRTLKKLNAVASKYLQESQWKKEYAWADAYRLTETQPYCAQQYMVWRSGTRWACLTSSGREASSLRSE